MGRTQGAKNKDIQLPAEYSLTPEQRLQMLANLLIEIIHEEEQCDQT